MKSVNHSVCIYLFVLTFFVLTYFVPKMIVKIGKRPGRIHCKKLCDISVFNGTMAHGACLSRSLYQQSFSYVGMRVFLGSTSTKLGLMCLAQGHNTVTPVRLKPAALWSRAKHSHSTIEPLSSFKLTNIL